MFDIGFWELVLVGVVALLVIGPEQLPGAVRSTALWLGSLRRSFSQIRSDIEREIGADDIRRQIHNDAVLKSLEQAKTELNDAGRALQNTTQQLPYRVDDILKPDSDTAAKANPQKPHDPQT